MTVGAPCVEGEHCAENTETYECTAEEEVLPSGIHGVVAGDLKDIPSEFATLGSGVPVDTDETDHEECGAAHEHKGKLHCGVFLAACAPNADEQIHRDERYLIEHEHREDVDGDEEAEHTGREECEPEEEVLGKGGYFPRGESAGEYDDCGKQEHQDGDTVDTDSQMDIERSIPHPASCEEHLVVDAHPAEAEEITAEPDRETQKYDGTGHHNGAYGIHTAVAAYAKSGHHEDGDYDKPY